MAEISEFEAAKERYAKRTAKKKPEPAAILKPPKKSAVTVIIEDPNGDYVFSFDTPYLAGSRMTSRRTREAYLEVVSGFIKKEFGKWQLRPTV